MDILAFIIGLVGAAAWIPAIINIFRKKHRRVSLSIVDYRIIEDAKIMDKNKKTIKESGTVLMLAVNLFIPYESFFARNITMKVYLNNNTSSEAEILDGPMYEKQGQENYVITCPNDYNFNLHREIVYDKDNIRIIPLLAKNISFDTIEQIDKIEIVLKNEILEKKIIIQNKDFPKLNRMVFFEQFVSKTDIQF